MSRTSIPDDICIIADAVVAHINVDLSRREDQVDHVAKALTAERKAAALRLADWIETQRKDIPAHGWEFAAAIRELCKLDVLRLNPSLSDRQYLEKIADQVIARNQPKAETSLHPAVETAEAQSGADASKVVCPALIDDVGGE